MEGSYVVGEGGWAQKGMMRSAVVVIFYWAYAEGVQPLHYGDAVAFF